MVSLACALGLASLLAAGPQTPAVNTSWEAFAARVQTGKKVAITLMDARHVEGTLREVDGTSLTVESRSQRRTIASADVYAVRYAGVRARRAKYGALIGAAVGAATMWANDQKSDHPEPGSAVAMGAILLGLPGGAVAGASWPTPAPLYQAERPATRAR